MVRWGNLHVLRLLPGVCGGGLLWAVNAPTMPAAQGRYLERHRERLERIFAQALSSVFTEQPEDPIGFIAHWLSASTPSSSEQFTAATQCAPPPLSKHELELAPKAPLMASVSCCAPPIASNPPPAPGSVDAPLTLQQSRAATVIQAWRRGMLARQPNMASSGWTAAAWLASCGIDEILAAALLHHHDARGRCSGSESRFLIGLARRHSGDDVAGRARIRRLLVDSGSLDQLVGAIWQGLSALRESNAADNWRALTRAEAATSGGSRAAEMLHSRFVHEGAAQLDYAGLESYFGGLERLVGPPDPRVHAAMATEHTARADCHIEFTTSNYGVTTTSAIEFAFVATPTQPPPSGWPVEARSMPRNARPRQPISIEDLQARLLPHNARLSRLGEPPVCPEEGIAARLYTGGCYVKYNLVLRGLGAGPDGHLMRNELVRCCSTSETYRRYMGGAPAAAPAAGTLSFDEVRPRLNTYTTTLHAINSVVVKLSKLTYATKVYRGVGGRVLPDAFWEANEFGMRGGVELGFMSCTRSRDVACTYALGGGSATTVIEMQQGMVSRGADVAFLSQYPHEEEVLFNPLTSLEVQGTHVEGARLIVQVHAPTGHRARHRAGHRAGRSRRAHRAGAHRRSNAQLPRPRAIPHAAPHRTATRHAACAYTAQRVVACSPLHSESACRLLSTPARSLV